MNQLARLFFLIWWFIYGSHFFCQAQIDIPINSWRTHFNYRNAQTIALANERTYCASTVGLFYFDREDNSLNKLSKIDGLSGGEISAIAFDNLSKILVIAYQNGGIDLLKDNTITSISTVNEANIAGSKRINHITFFEPFAYLSTDFGLVLLDLEKGEIKEAYDQISAQGTKLGVSGSTVWKDSLYLATEGGIIAGSLDPKINLQDFTNWRRFNLGNDGLPQLPYINIVTLDNSLIAGHYPDKLYQYKEDQWLELPIQLGTSIVAINSSPDKVIIILSDRLIIVEPNDEETTIQEALIAQPQQAAIDQSGVLWVADLVNGLVSNFEEGYQSLFPSGPFANHFWSFATGTNSSLVATSGGFDNNTQPLGRLEGFYQFSQGEWTNFNSTRYSRTELSPKIQDLVDVNFNPVDQKYYLASISDGLVQWDGSDFNIINENTPGSPLVNSNPPNGFTQVSAAKVDTEGAVWVTNYGNNVPLHRYQPADNSWQSFSFALAVAQYPVDILIAANADKWLRLDPNQGGGILLINKDISLQKYITNIDGSGGLPSRDITVIIEDLEQSIWVGTELGLGIFPFAPDLLNQEQIDAIIPTIEGRPILKDEFITCIEIDGGNRKWVGTENGVWLFTEGGDSVVYNFTSKNSPLPSDFITGIHILPESGEVFFATDKGLVSFRAGATAATEMHQFVKIFPNPVTRDFSGNVGISGLARNAIIKITDVSGKLITETRAQGGTAVWNVADYQGRRVASGVYLIFSATADGDQTFVGKVAVIN